MTRNIRITALAILGAGMAILAAPTMAGDATAQQVAQAGGGMGQGPMGPRGNAPMMAPEADEPIYGSQMMTEQERIEQRERMRTARTDEERNRIRQEHHDRMQERAKQRGITLPEEMPAGRGPGMGRGMGGPGQGMGGPGR